MRFLFSLVIIVAVAIFFFIPLVKNETIVQCVTTPCPPMVTKETPFEYLKKQQVSQREKHAGVKEGLVNESL